MGKKGGGGDRGPEAARAGNVDHDRLGCMRVVSTRPMISVTTGRCDVEEVVGGTITGTMSCCVSSFRWAAFMVLE